MEPGTYAEEIDGSNGDIISMGSEDPNGSPRVSLAID